MQIEWFSEAAIDAGYARRFVALGIQDAAGRFGYAEPSALDWERVITHPIDGTEWQRASLPSGGVVWRREAVRGDGRGLGWEIVPAEQAEAAVADAIATREALDDRDYAEAVGREASEAAAAASSDAVRAAVAALYPGEPDAVLDRFMTRYGSGYEVSGGVLLQDGWREVGAAELAPYVAASHEP